VNRLKLSCAAALMCGLTSFPAMAAATRQGAGLTPGQFMCQLGYENCVSGCGGGRLCTAHCKQQVANCTKKSRPATRH
jgi:hypothetical protein